MKICIIGASGHYGYVLKSLSKGMKISGIAPGSAGENIGVLRNDMKKMGLLAKEYSDYRKMLDIEKPDIVVVNTFFSNNGKILKYLLERKINAFVEKPIAASLEELNEIKNLYEKVKEEMFFTAMFGLRYKAHFLTAKLLIDSGKIGEIRLINTQKSYKLGTRPDFYKRRDTYTGTILWVGIHAIDWINWFSKKKFLKIYATHSRIANKNHGELESTALCHFTLEDEVFASLSIDYLRPSSAPTHDDDRIRIAGTKGVMEVINGRVYLISDEGPVEPDLVEEKQIFTDFIAQITGKGPCMVTPQDSILATEIALLARESADTEKIIELKEGDDE
ncbi:MULTISPECIES: Gfo/Idh/MocA family protein [Pseudothermotoga]|jgi:predicted dehydrogenase|uniref:Oxidoreductase domain protein n=2 Tax=Pseudothermotoga TaxID=1643951 RepID=A8F6B3_PSELT|nr:MULTISPECIES: Gfo/Idh/MocA family oxidoreductase [Pseudothermotoga]ABV33697.1 oxidoreductase domain protein [Pseudothermotoga lettingae TMO]KUK21087.1 MAG: Oxidoreductase domain protein [Pseudothermotoga lettingae]MDI3494764.1 hypothetical protein [Pseudothermotoga sp.]GLI49385.1 oxidoreductase [Pseudothermotoga lettingae TMO]